MRSAFSHGWLNRLTGNAVKEHFISYLSGKFSNIAEVNRLWEQIIMTLLMELPPDGNVPYASRADRGRDYE
jgi:hypothetical protein